MKKEQPVLCDLQKQMMADLGMVEADFAGYRSDLYVVASPAVQAWLKKNYEFARFVTNFTSNIGSNWNGAGKPCYLIPFIRMDVWIKEQ